MLISCRLSCAGAVACDALPAIRTWHRVPVHNGLSVPWQAVDATPIYGPFALRAIHTAPRFPALMLLAIGVALPRQPPRQFLLQHRHRLAVQRKPVRPRLVNITTFSASVVCLPRNSRNAAGESFCAGCRPNNQHAIYLLDRNT